MRFINPKIQNSSELPPAFVVADFEWNQPVPWLHARVSYKDLPGEIIEIGAAKLVWNGEEYCISETFRRYVRPMYYTVMNKNVSAIVQRSSAALKQGHFFKDAYKEFQQWCGNDFILCGWSFSDIPILKANLKIHKMDHKLNALFLDVQPLFSMLAEGENKQRSVEYAVDFLQLPKKKMFHEAKEDAYYTALILKKLLDMLEQDGELPDVPEYASRHILRDHMMNPDIRTEKVWETGLFPAWEKCFEEACKIPVYCPECMRKLVFRVGWFRLKKSAFSLWFCNEHHLISGRMRMKKTPDQKIYASIRIKLDGPVGERVVYDKKAEYDEFGCNGKPFIPADSTVETDSF